jgi:hypothetical protein
MKTACSIWFLLCLAWLSCSAKDSGPFLLLTDHSGGNSDLGELRDLKAEWRDGRLELSTSGAERHAWAVIPAPNGRWDLSRRAVVSAEIVNTGAEPVGILFWVVGNHGWDAVVDVASVAPGESRTFSCDLRATFPDGTPKLNPGDVKQVQVMLGQTVLNSTKPRVSYRITKPVSVAVGGLKASGELPEWKRPPGRLDVPDVEIGPPAAGKRVRYQLEGDAGTGIYSVLNLPEDWRPGKKYPVVVEYPGNIFFVPACYSSGLPDQCVIGYGMTKGRGAICLGLPFVDRASKSPVENSWGNPDDTVDHALRMVAEVCARFGGDRENIVLTGFSRGALACGYIGLRNDRIAGLWKGIHACQHYDGDGWNGATMAGALERATRFKGLAVFQTDNSQSKFQAVMDAMKTDVTWVDSGLGAHATAMFLDDRPSTRQLREWFRALVAR